MHNHYFDDSHPLRPYTYSLAAMSGTIAPVNALRGEAPTVKEGFWPCEKDGGWAEIEDHRGAKGYLDGTPHTITDLGPLPEGWSDSPPPPTAEERELAATQLAATEADSLLRVRMRQQLVQTAAFSAEEFSLFAKAKLFDAWTPGADYTAGQRFVHEGVVYEARQDVTAQAHQAPGGAGMLAVYRPLSVDADSGEATAGTLENPNAFTHGMDVYSGQYYACNESVYLAKADMIPCVWAPDTTGLWQWEKIS